MKTCAILLGNPNDNLDCNLLMQSCVNRVIAKGYTIVHPTTWEEYRSINMDSFIDKVKLSIDCYYIFIDLGLTDLIIDLVKANHPPKNKELKIEIGYDDSYFTPQYFLREVSAKTMISISVLQSKSRMREVVEARQIYFYRARKHTECSLSQIGKLVKRDHATVLHGVKVVDTAPEVKRKYERLFTGKKEEKRIVHKVNTEITRQDKDMLIGRTPGKVVNMKSPFAGVAPANNREYSGYRVHSL
jgi:hypothetical protein